jgi:hypothetical protein
MTVTIVTEPTYLLPGKEAQIIASASSGNMTEVVCTSAPTGSEIQSRLEDEDREELQIYPPTQTGIKRAFTFDAPGKYVCTIREYQKGGVTFGGDYADDPEGYKSEDKLSETSYSFTVGQRLTAPLRMGNDTGTVTMYVWDDTVRGTNVPVHGEKSPRFDGDTERMKIAERDTNVVAALTALEDQTAATIASSLATVADDLIDTFNDHIGRTSQHGSADSDSTINTNYKGACTQEALGEAITTLVQHARYHYLNQTSTGSGIGSKDWHAPADWDNLPSVTGAQDALTASVALASLWTSINTHRLDDGPHTSTGSDAPTALPPLLNLYRRINDVAKSDNPTAPNVENPGATLLVARAGLVKG